MNLFIQAWQVLTLPPRQITDSRRRRQLQLLAGLQLLLIILGTIAITLESHLLLKTFIPTYTVVSIGIFLLVGAYVLARLGHYNSAAFITVTVTGLTCLAIIFLNPQNNATYAFLALSLILASLLFERRGLLLTALFLLLGVSLALPLLGAPAPNNNTVLVPIFLVLVSAVLLTYRQHLRAIAQDQQAILANQNAKTRAIVDNAFDAIVTIDAQGAIDAFNPAAEDMFGFQAQEVVGKNISLLIQAALQEMRRISVPLQLIARHKEGRQFPVELSISEMRTGGQRIYTAFIRDITQRRAAEERVLQLNRLLRTLTAITQMVARERSTERLLSEACRIIVEHGEYRMAWIGQADLAAGTVRVAAKAGIDDGYLARANIRCDNSPQGQGPTGIAIREGQYVVNNDSLTDPRFEPWRESAHQHGYGSSAAFPLRVGGQIFGTVNVYAENPDAFQEEEVGLLTEMAGDLSYALQMIEVMAAHDQAEQALAQSEANFRSLTANANVGILVNCQGRHVFGNTQILDMLGYTLEQLRSTGIAEIVHPSETAAVMQRFGKRMSDTATEQVYETIFLARDGCAVPVEISATKTIWEGVPCGLIFVHDISARRQAEARMRQLSSALEQTADAVLITDINGVIEYVNPAFEQITGFAPAEVLGQNPRLICSGKHSAEFYESLWNTILAGHTFRDVFINRRKNGEHYFEEKTITPLKNSAGQITHFISTGKDVTERMQVQERLEYIAQHDALTELPNRLLLLDRLNQAIARARWHQRVVALLFVDLDRFKTINDSLGHETGDLILQQIAIRLNNCVREGDTVARFGGDEFVILLDDVANESDIRSLSKKVLDALLPPFKVAAQQFYITASIGISLFPNDGADASTLLKNADIAMYRAKEQGKNAYRFYSAEMSARAFERLTLESSLRHALARGELRLFYQPVVDAQSGVILSVEALLRWQHPDFGLVLPGDFIPLLEETGWIVPAGEWVLETACAQLHAWHKLGWPALRLAVNLSTRQLQSENLVRTLESCLTNHSIRTGQLELEITEGLLMDRSGATTELLGALRALGVRLAVDDFGTGYSSLSYLRSFPIDTLKIDRSFVHDIPGDATDSAITTAIIVLAQSLKLNVVAEGIETPAQRDFLQSLGCHNMQGFWFSRPLPPEELTLLLQARNTRLAHT